MTATSTTVLWDREPPASRDRSARLTRDEIAAAAFALAEAETLPAVSVKRVAGRLGIPGARLQAYLHDRAELLDLMVEVALGELDGGVPTTDDWQVQLWRLAHLMRDSVRRHPWLAGLLGLRAPTGPNGLRFTERTLVAMAPSGVDIATAAQCVETVLAFVCGIVRPDALSASGTGGAAPVEVAGYLQREVSTETHPLLTRLLAASSTVTADEVFDIGLSYLLAGMASGISGADSALLALVDGPAPDRGP